MTEKNMPARPGQELQANCNIQQLHYTGHRDDRQVPPSPQPLAEILDQYINAGFAIVPIYEAVHVDGAWYCCCGKPDCRSPGKHPRVQQGLNDASRDPETVGEWLRLWPDMNVAIATGSTSGFFVLDVDPRHGGDSSLASLIEKHGPLPTTAVQHTGGGGFHYLFRMPDFSVGNSAGRIGHGIDVRGNGGMIVVAPSRHVSGGQYFWASGRPPTLEDIAEAPEWLLGLIQKPQAKSSAASRQMLDVDVTSSTICEGRRNAALMSLAGKMHFHGLDAEAILAALQAHNRKCCCPPLHENEVASIAASVLRYPSGGDFERSSLTDVGNAKRFAALASNRFRFCHNLGWMRWDGSRWIRDENQGHLAFAQVVAGLIHNEAASVEESKRAALRNWARASQSASKVKAMLEMAKPDLSVSVDKFDTDSMLLNVTNGTIYLRTGQLRPHSPSDLLTKIAPVAYDQSAQCPQFMRFISEIMCENIDIVNFLQRWLGYCLTGDVSEQFLPIFYGGGANGKSTLQDVLLTLSGDYGGLCAPDLLIERRSSEHPTEVADLFGKRLVFSSETEGGASLKLQRIKQMTGDATLKGRFMRQDFFDFKRTHKLAMVTNNLPVIRENSDAVWRRIILVPFNFIVPESQRDPKLLDKLRGEMPGILNWLVAGCLAWHRDGLCIPPVVRGATQDYRFDEDRLGQFFEEQCTVCAGLKVTRAALLDACMAFLGAPHNISSKDLYLRCCQLTGVSKCSWRDQCGSPVRGFTGIGLRPQQGASGQPPVAAVAGDFI